MNDVNTPDLRTHTIRTALLELLAEVGTVTATEAATRLGHSSGLCSFHLRQLERHGLIEEAPHTGGRARPWRLKRHADAPAPTADEQFGTLARGLEDESWQRWLRLRDQAPAGLPREEAFSTVAYLTPAEMTQVARTIQQLLARYQDREQRPLARPEGALPVALITRLFPLVAEAEGEAESTDGSDRG